MELPDVQHKIRDSERNIEYTVMAYRQLTREEVVQSVRAHLAATKKKPRKNSRITILTVLGATDGL